MPRLPIPLAKFIKWSTEASQQEMIDLSKKAQDQKSGLNGWKYKCACGFETLQVGSAVAHINSNPGHQLQRIEL